MFKSFVSLLILIVGLALGSTSVTYLEEAGYPKGYEKEYKIKLILLLILGIIITIIGGYLLFCYKN